LRRAIHPEEQYKNMKIAQILTLTVVAAGLAFFASCKKSTPAPPPAYDTTPGYVAPSK
jgi:hypothetical protein